MQILDSNITELLSQDELNVNIFRWILIFI